MVSLSLSASSSMSSSSQLSFKDAPASPASNYSHNGSASSSRISLSLQDDENDTITSSSLAKRKGKLKSDEDLRSQATTLTHNFLITHMTELSYNISDIQTRIFEIQELRHKSQIAGDPSNTTLIDQSLMNLDERLEASAKGMKSVNDALEPILQSAPTPTLAHNGETSENAAILRKHAALVAEWEAVQDETDVLREELKEDKWLTVFRTVTDQADGMMSSLEKAVNRCQDFIWQVHRRGPDESYISLSSSIRSDKSPLSLDVFTSLLESYEAKKKHYMPATSKVLSIIDRGVQDRVTKNGETLRRHAESAQRWRNLRDRITRTDAEMEGVRKILISGELTPSENGSSNSGAMSTRNGYLATPPSGSRGSSQSRGTSASSSISRSISPFRKFARKITGTSRGPPPVTPLSISGKNGARTPSSEPLPSSRTRTSMFTLRGNQPPSPVTPEKFGHKYSHSYTSDSPSQVSQVSQSENNATVKSRPNKQRWNSSTKVQQEERSGTLKARRPSAGGTYSSDDIPPVPPLAPQYKRSPSRSSISSSRPWTPLTSSVSTSNSSYHPIPSFRPPSRAQTPSRSQTPGLSVTPRSRPKTPSNIPAPAKWRSISGAQSEGGWNDDDGPMFVPQLFSSTSTPGGLSPPLSAHPPRPPSRSMIPVPSLHLSSASRPGSAMSRPGSMLSHYRPDSRASSSFRSSANRAQTPESALKARAQQVPFYQGRPTPRPSLQTKMPPSSFRDSTTMRTPSRPGSRTGAFTPVEQNPVHEYFPSKDPLDMEVATICNSIAHGLLIERVDPPLQTVPPEGTEIKAQYAFSNALSRKVVTCKLTTLTRPGVRANGDATTKKVMCRVGGGWQDLQLYMLNRQAGM